MAVVSNKKDIQKMATVKLENLELDFNERHNLKMAFAWEASAQIALKLDNVDPREVIRLRRWRDEALAKAGLGNLFKEGEEA